MLSTQQAAKGFRRLNDLVSDLSLDTPNAGAILAGFTQRAKDDCVLQATFEH
jgi:hypothetical protein